MSLPLIILLLAIFVLLILLYALMPRTALHQQCGEFCGLLYAHRGLWSQEDGVPENSMTAFSGAVKAGFAIELDVQLTKDHKAVIFHDSSLKRMCSTDGKLRDYTLAQLKSMRLADSNETIPEFAEVLKLVAGQVPLLIELKSYHTNTDVCKVVTTLLLDYKGKYCIESFSPFILHWYRKNQPDTVRGQLSCRFGPDEEPPRPLLFLSEHLMFNWYGRPDFIAYEFHRGSHLFALKFLRKCFGTPAFAWTIHSENTLKKSRKYFDSVIFDRFIPDCPTQKLTSKE